MDFGWFQAPPGRLRPMFEPIRHFDANLLSRGQIRHYIDTIWALLSLISGSSSLEGRVFVATFSGTVARILLRGCRKGGLGVYDKGL